MTHKFNDKVVYNRERELIDSLNEMVQDTRPTEIEIVKLKKKELKI